jgi:ABC-type Fe3+-hydroxamate transport system substrate-binding protein
VKRLLAVLAVTLAALTACTSAADTASQNVSAAADNFEVNRRIVGINLRTGETLFLVEGACSLTRDGDLVVICKTGSKPDTFTKNYFGLGPNGGDGVTYVSTQLGPVQANQWRTRIILRPTTVVPDFDLQVGF